jgi:hypothetical protein
MDAPISAHFDGQSIVPDGPVPFSAGQKLVVGSATAADAPPVEFRDGNIRLKVSRISLDIFLYEFFRDRSVDALASRFSTIDRQQIADLIAFVEANEPFLRMYHAAEQWREEMFCSQERRGPSLETLRQRAKERGINLSG